ncbi:hypothetical protein KALB_4985 [Kutzneria albida DSM 43870]|uniref:Helix-turn-helix domain-containing protein n=2 Tax=Kutzneria TaxID=43356 RepID=W5WBS9_9PSEU|nr:hypothetical protein KALB_4985 [Kutzneria albida DSM 43870]
MDGFLTAAELAERLGVSEPCVRYHLRRGHIWAERHGPGWVIPLAEADRLVGEYSPYMRWTKAPVPAKENPTWNC